jgi:alpha-tubulin suppressor-like RCC1 family protein
VPLSVPGVDAQDLDSGTVATCATVEDGTVRCWGANYLGQFGDGTTTGSASPVIGASGTYKSLEMGDSHACAVRTDGVPACWGRNDFDQLGAASASTCTSGMTTLDCSLTPLAGTGLEHIAVMDIGAGWGFTCTLMANGTVQCWGQNVAGQLGDGTGVDRSSAAPVCASGSGLICSGGDLLRDVTDLAVGAFHACALQIDGDVLCWGFNASGQVGDGTTTDRFSPVLVFTGAIDVAAGHAHSCALVPASWVYCWGANDSGQLGDGTTTSSLTDVQVCASGSGGGCVDLFDVRELTAGGSTTCAVMHTRSMRCWGSGFFGETGNGTFTATNPNPVPVCASGSGSGCPTLSPATSVDEGEGGNTCAAMTSGEVACWGKAGANFLGVDSALPGLASGITTAVAVATGAFHACALLADGTVKCWGGDHQGQLGNGGGIGNGSATPVTAVGVADAVDLAAGYSHTCVVLADATVQCWGNNTVGQLGNGASGDQDVAGSAAGTDMDNDGCSDVEEDGPNHKFGGERNRFYFWDYFDVTADRFIDLSDALDVLGFFGNPGTSPAANLRDRDIGGPDVWDVVESSTGIDLTDALTVLASFGDSCGGIP